MAVGDTSSRDRPRPRDRDRSDIAWIGVRASAAQRRTGADRTQNPETKTLKWIEPKWIRVGNGNDDDADDMNCDDDDCIKGN